MQIANPYAKAVVAGLAAAIAFAIPVVDDGLAASEVLGIVLSGLVGSGITYAVPNRPKRGKRNGTPVTGA